MGKHHAFLAEGAYTVRDQTVKNAIELIERTWPTEQPLTKISRYIRMRFEPARFDARTRSASEIIKSGYTRDYVDCALVFIALAREMGYPTKFVETINPKWLESPEDISIKSSHAFADVYFEGAWRKYEPRLNFTTNDEYEFRNIQYIELGKGIDHSAIYIKENGVYRTTPVHIDSRETFKRIVLELHGGRR